MRWLLWFGAAFYFFEAIIHGLGLAILEHDKIFLPTHDRYIAIFALTYAALLILIATDLKKYRHLFVLTMAGICVSIVNAAVIAQNKWYPALFQTTALDNSLSLIGGVAVVWYVAVWLLWWKQA